MPAVLAKPTIHAFTAGTVHSVRSVARFFDKSKPWVGLMLRRGKLRGSRIDGTGNWMIDGESVRELYGRLMLASDLAGAEPTRLPEDQSKAAAKQALKDLGNLNKGVKS